jgi:hypothetical protein
LTFLELTRMVKPREVGLNVVYLILKRSGGD